MTLQTIGVIFQVEQYSETTRLGLETKTERHLERGENDMSNEVHGGSDLILGLHTGGGTTATKIGDESQTSVFDLRDDLVRALLHPFWDLKKKSEYPFVFGVVADYATKLVRLMNAKTQIESAVTEVLKRFNGTPRVITFATDFEKHCFTSITIRVKLNGRPLYPEVPRPPNLIGDIRQAIADILQSLGITPPHIIIPSDYSDADEP